MCFNTLIRTIEKEKIKLLGYNYTNALSPHDSFQFADDTALATATQEDSQASLNVFPEWCQWANLKICIDKCRCFDIKKNGKQSIQFRSYLKVNNEMIPAVKLNDSFVYLQKKFCYNMSCESVNCDLVKRLSNTWRKLTFFTYIRNIK